MKMLETKFVQFSREVAETYKLTKNLLIILLL